MASNLKASTTFTVKTNQNIKTPRMEINLDKKDALLA